MPAITYTVAETYSDLRAKILAIRPGDLGLPGDPGSETGVPPVGVLMETGYPEAVATLVALADGTTSLYFSNGGGVIGAGEHEAVAATTRRFIGTSQEFLSHTSLTTTFPLPAEGRVRFYFVTGAGVYGMEAAQEDLGRGEHPLSPLFHEGHRVLTAVREHTEG